MRLNYINSLPNLVLKLQTHRLEKVLKLCEISSERDEITESHRLT